MTPALFRPCLATLLRGLPHAYRQVAAPVGARVQVCIETEAGGTWALERTDVGWELVPPATAPPATAPPAVGITLGPNVAWKLFTKGMPPAEARQHARVTGDEALASAVFGLVAVMG